MNAGIKLSFNNKYYIELIEASTGDIKQEGIFHNIVTNRFGSCLAGTISNKSEAYSRGTYRIPARIYVGSGTTEPTVPPVAAPTAVVVKVNPAVMPHRVNSSAMIDVITDVIKILFESTMVFLESLFM